MRTTVTLDPDVAAFIQRLMRERGISAGDAVNEAIRAAIAPDEGAAFHTPVRHMGEPKVPLTKALRLAGELEDEERIRGQQGA